MPLRNVDAATLTLILQFCERKATDGPRMASELKATDGPRLASEAEAAKRLAAEADASLAEAADLERRLAAEAEAARRKAAEAAERRVAAAERAAAVTRQAMAAEAALTSYICGGVTFADWEKAFVAELQLETLLSLIAVRHSPGGFRCMLSRFLLAQRERGLRRLRTT